MDDETTVLKLPEKQYAERARRVSTLSRSDAIHGYHPVKQTSNPLPEPSRIYERDHVHSRSWNLETGQCTSPPLPPSQQNSFQYYQVNEVYPSDRHQYIPTINEPSVHLGVRFPRQAKSFDDRVSPRNVRRKSMDRRTLSEAERTTTRQSTAQHLQPETPVAAACQSLWAAKGHLEELHALGISDPSSASTSFESNTENSPAAGSGECKKREEGADKKRLQYNTQSSVEPQTLRTIEPPLDATWRRQSFRSSKKFRRRITVHSPDRSPPRRTSRDSQYSQELREMFTRRGSQLADSRHASMSSAPLGDRHDSVFSNDSRRLSHELREINHDRWQQARNLTQNHSHTNSTELKKEVQRRQPTRENRDLRCYQDDLRRQRVTSRDAFYEVHNRPFSRELPLRPSFEESRDTLKAAFMSAAVRRWQLLEEALLGEEEKRRQSLLSNVNTPRNCELRFAAIVRKAMRRRERRKLDSRRPWREVLPEAEKDGKQEHHHRRTYYARPLAKSHDANFWPRNESPDSREWRSLFLRRKFLSTAAVSSLDSTNSTESSAPEAIFASSVDSAGSDLEHRRISLLNRIPTGSVPHIISRPFASTNRNQSSLQRGQLQDRDYSVDAQSDTLFREWSRIDPAYENRGTPREPRESRRRLDKVVSEDPSSLRPERARVYSRQLTANPGGSVVVPFICYPDENNCTR